LKAEFNLQIEDQADRTHDANQPDQARHDAPWPPKYPSAPMTIRCWVGICHRENRPRKDTFGRSYAPNRNHT